MVSSAPSKMRRENTMEKKLKQHVSFKKIIFYINILKYLKILKKN
jgi:hypothetical protein